MGMPSVPNRFYASGVRNHSHWHMDRDPDPGCTTPCHPCPLQPPKVAPSAPPRKAPKRANPGMFSMKKHLQKTVPTLPLFPSPTEGWLGLGHTFWHWRPVCHGHPSVCVRSGFRVCTVRRTFFCRPPPPPIGGGGGAGAFLSMRGLGPLFGRVLNQRKLLSGVPISGPK